MAAQVQDSEVIKELLSLNVATYGLAQPSSSTNKKDKEEPATPFLSL